MVNLSWLPGSQLIQRAVDATRLAGAIIDHRKRQRAVVLAEESARVARFRGRRAAESIRELYEAGDVRGLARLFVPDAVIEVALGAKDVWWKIWDIYWIFALLRVALVVFLPQSGYIHPDGANTYRINKLLQKMQLLCSSLHFFNSFDAT